jgi:hypothetical protein
MAISDIEVGVRDETLAGRTQFALSSPSRDLQSQRAPRGPMRCHRCGFAVDVFAGHPDETLLRALCCPRCDGRLVRVGAGPRQPSPRGEPSIDVG